MNLFEMYKENDDVYMVKDGDKDRYLVMYKSLGADWNNRLTRKARGSVITEKGLYIIKSYNKFFNENELVDRNDIEEDVKTISMWQDTDYHVTDKVDGSTIKVSYDERYEEFVVCSSTSFNGEHVQRFRRFMEENLDLDELKFWARKATLIFEYVSSDLQIVIDYGKEDIYLHGVIDNATEIEYDYTMANYIADSIKSKMVTRFKFTREHMKELQKTAEGIEGFVITFDNGIKLKMKTDWYLDKHVNTSIFFGNTCTKNNINLITDMYFDGTIDDFISECQNRNKHSLLELSNLVISVAREFQDVKKTVIRFVEEHYLTRAEIARILKAPHTTIAFTYLDDKDMRKVEKKFITDFTRDIWEMRNKRG